MKEYEYATVVLSFLLTCLLVRLVRNGMPALQLNTTRVGDDGAPGEVRNHGGGKSAAGNKAAPVALVPVAPISDERIIVQETASMVRPKGATKQQRRLIRKLLADKRVKYNSTSDLEVERFGPTSDELQRVVVAGNYWRCGSHYSKVIAQHEEVIEKIKREEAQARSDREAAERVLTERKMKYSIARRVARQEFARVKVTTYEANVNNYVDSIARSLIDDLPEFTGDDAWVLNRHKRIAEFLRKPPYNPSNNTAMIAHPRKSLYTLQDSLNKLKKKTLSGFYHNHERQCRRFLLLYGLEDLSPKADALIHLSAAIEGRENYDGILDKSHQLYLDDLKMTRAALQTLTDDDLTRIVTALIKHVRAINPTDDLEYGLTEFDAWYLQNSMEELTSYGENKKYPSNPYDDQ